MSSILWDAAAHCIPLYFHNTNKSKRGCLECVYPLYVCMYVCLAALPMVRNMICLCDIFEAGVGGSLVGSEEGNYFLSGKCAFQSNHRHS